MLVVHMMIQNLMVMRMFHKVLKLILIINHHPEDSTRKQQQKIHINNSNNNYCNNNNSYCNNNSNNNNNNKWVQINLKDLFMFKYNQFKKIKCNMYHQMHNQHNNKKEQ